MQGEAMHYRNTSKIPQGLFNINTCKSLVCQHYQNYRLSRKYRIIHLASKIFKSASELNPSNLLCGKGKQLPAYNRGCPPHA